MKMTPYQKHCKRWKKCTRCNLCNTRNSVVLLRGRVPADILFIGEAPGTSEDVLGKPFVGPAGKLLDRIIEQGIDGQIDYVLTNLVACIPLDSEGTKPEEPPESSIQKCAPRLRECVKLVDPRLVVFVGKLAAKHGILCIPATVFATVEIIHPAAILRMDVSQKGLAVHAASWYSPTRWTRFLSDLYFSVDYL